MSTPGRPMQRLYTIDGEPGWTVECVAFRVCKPGSGLTYATVAKRLAAGANTWKELTKPPRNLKHRTRPANPRPSWKTPQTAADVARNHVEDIESQRNRLLIAWRGPVEQGQLVARIGA